MPIGFAILGCGAVAGHHAAGILDAEDAFLAGAADARPGAAQAFCARWGGRAYADESELLKDPSADVVCVCTPSGFHAAQAIRVLESGRSALVEKPLALTVEEADQVIEMALRTGGKVGVVSQTRFTPAFEALKAAVDGAWLGRVVFADAAMRYSRTPEYYQSGGWRGTWKMDGGGALMNQGIHGADALVALMGEPKSVYGLARTLVHEIETEDSVAAALEYRSGALGLLQASTSVAPGYPRRISVCGSLGTAEMDERGVCRWDVPGRDLPEAARSDADKPSGSSVPMNIDREGHARHILDMVHALTEGTQPKVNMLDGRKAVRLIRAVYESSATGRRIDL